MRVSVRCGVARPAQLRGAARSVLLLQRVAPASRGSQRFGRRARLDQGCAHRLVAAAAADGEPEPALPRSATGGEEAQAEPQKRKQRAPNVGEYGEKTADGKPEPDERTVAELVERGWFESEDEVLQVLGKVPKRSGSRFPYETAKPVADWLEATLGHEPLKNGWLPAAKAVKTDPSLLWKDAATLQRKWDALTLPAEQGGVGCMLSEEQAREAVRKHPPILGFATDTLKRGWSMLTATEGGLGLSPEEAHWHVLQSPRVLGHGFEQFTKRVELLKSLGYPKAYDMILSSASLAVLNYKEETVREHAVWWMHTGLDHVKIITSMPDLLGAPTTAELHAKLDFLSVVAGMSTAELNKAGVLFTLSLDGRLRARYFYALLKGRLARFTSMNTLMKETDATFLAMLQGQTSRGRASELEVARYDKLVKSAKFVAWRERQEAQRMAAAPPPAARDHA
jgi:hypothetical protein